VEEDEGSECINYVLQPLVSNFSEELYFFVKAPMRASISGP
jgi:hypothetical protein